MKTLGPLERDLYTTIPVASLMMPKGTVPSTDAYSQSSVTRLHEELMHPLCI